MDKDIEILQDWIARDRQMRNNLTESDYDKFCEEKCKAIESLICKLADLEAKLAESEEAIKYLQGIKRYDIGELITKNGQLKQQLAEKDNALQLACDELDDAKDMLRDAGKNEWASLLNTSADYFKSKAKGKK